MKSSIFIATIIFLLSSFYAKSYNQPLSELESKLNEIVAHCMRSDNYIKFSSDNITFQEIKNECYEWFRLLRKLNCNLDMIFRVEIALYYSNNVRQANVDIQKVLDSYSGIKGFPANSISTQDITNLEDENLLSYKEKSKLLLNKLNKIEKTRKLLQDSLIDLTKSISEKDSILNNLKYDIGFQLDAIEKEIDLLKNKCVAIDNKILKIEKLTDSINNRIVDGNKILSLKLDSINQDNKQLFNLTKDYIDNQICNNCTSGLSFTFFASVLPNSSNDNIRSYLSFGGLVEFNISRFLTNDKYFKNISIWASYFSPNIKTVSSYMNSQGKVDSWDIYIASSGIGWESPVINEKIRDNFFIGGFFSNGIINNSNAQIINSGFSNWKGVLFRNELCFGDYSTKNPVDFVFGIESYFNSENIYFNSDRGKIPVSNPIINFYAGLRYNLWIKN